MARLRRAPSIRVGGGIDRGAIAPQWAGRGVAYLLEEDMTVMNPATMQRVPADGETMGEIMFRGNITMKGYLKNPKATEEAFAGGWFHSGRPGCVAARRLRQIKDRSKDIIISGGENISSQEVEDVLCRHPSVMLAAVVALPDAKWGEVPAFVELKEGATGDEAEMVEFCRAHGALQGARGSCSSPCRRRRRERSRSLCCANGQKRNGD